MDRSAAPSEEGLEGWLRAAARLSPCVLVVAGSGYQRKGTSTNGCVGAMRWAMGLRVGMAGGHDTGRGMRGCAARLMMTNG